MYTSEEMKKRIEGIMRCWTGEKGWQLQVIRRIEDHEGVTEQFPIQREWVYVE